MYHISVLLFSFLFVASCYAKEVVVEAEDYTSMRGIRTQGTHDSGGGRNIGWINNGDWVRYAVVLPASGQYRVAFRVASRIGADGIELRDEVGKTLATLAVPNTGAWQSWATIETEVSLEAGSRELTLFFTDSGINVNWIRFTPISDPVTDLPEGFELSPIGGVSQPQIAEQGAVYSIDSEGGRVGGQTDQLHFVHAELSEGGSVAVRLADFDSTNADATAGLMLRDTLSETSRFAAFSVHPQKGSAFTYRANDGQPMASTWQASPSRWDNHLSPTPYRARYLSAPKWLKLVREASSVKTYSSDDGLCWHLRWQQAMTFDGSVFAGVALASASDADTAALQFEGLSLAQGIPEDINASCPRAQADGELKAPSSWVFKPASLGGLETWSYSLSNPNAAPRPASCIEGGAPERRRLSPDNPDCPAEVLNSAWTTAAFNFSSGVWQNNQAMPIQGGSSQIPYGTKSVWLYKNFNLAASELNQTVFWGRWSNSVSIYVNGVLATNTFKSNLSQHFHYLGMNDTARQALVVGENTLAVRLDCLGCGQLYFDMGIGLNANLVAAPINVHRQSSSEKDRNIAQVFTDFTKEMGSLGGTLAISQNGVITESRSQGWKDIQLSQEMPLQPVMRLASVDKRATEAMIAHLYQSGLLSPDARVFPDVLDYQPAPGRGWGSGVRDITVDQLRLHSSGISNLGGGQAWQDEVAFRFGISASELEREHLIRTLIAEPTDFTPGSREAYSSNGYAILRYIVEEVTGKTVEQFLQQDMGANDIVISYERLGGRHQRETNYHIVGKETRSRWFELEAYLALSASADQLALFFDRYAAAYQRNGNQFAAVSGGQGGAMDGTRSGADNNKQSQRGIANIWNSDLAGSNRYEDRKNQIEGSLSDGSCDPRNMPESRFRLQNDWQKHIFIHTEPDSNGEALKAEGLENAGWESAKWRFQKVVDNGVDYYLIINAWKPWRALTMSSGDLAAGSFSNNDADAHWLLKDSGTYFKIESRSNPGQIINIENSMLSASNVPDYFHSSRWMICN